VVDPCPSPPWLLFALYPSLCVVENIGNEEGRKIRVEGEGGERKKCRQEMDGEGGGNDL